MAHVIGIGGSSRSGKSTLANMLRNDLSGHRMLLLDMDDYVFDEEDIPRINNCPDWEQPKAFDFERLIATINTNQDLHDVIIVEGILAFADEKLTKLYDRTIFIKISKKTFLERRKKEKRWGSEPDWYIAHVWDAFLQYGQFPDADFTVCGERPVHAELLTDITSTISTKESG